MLDESTPLSATGKAVDLPLPGGPATTIIRGCIRRGGGRRPLIPSQGVTSSPGANSTESAKLDVGIGPGLHVGGKLLLHAPPLFIDDTEVLKLLSGLLDALAGLLELLFLEAGHFLFVVGINRGPGEIHFLDLFSKAVSSSLW